MLKRKILLLVTLIMFASLALTASAEKPLVLFDEGHAQKAGNADWVIDGGFSDFADAFKANGCEVKAVKQFTAEVLKNARIVVLPEPNSVYSAAEQDALVNFVDNGGCLYAVSDHDKSDRNGDGIDSVGVLNQFLPRLGLKIDKRYFTEAPVSGEYFDTEFTVGVKSVGTWGGSTISCLASSARGHITVSSKNGGNAYIASNVTGSRGGKVIAMGDSSPYDDGSGDPRDKLHDGYNNPRHDHERLAHNTIKWLLKKESTGPISRMHALMANIQELNRNLREKLDPDSLRFAENQKSNLARLLNNDSGLQKIFSTQARGNPEFSGLVRQINQRKVFRQLHQEK
ncbi:MAG: hypothetical protein AB1403_20860 [Candidatus Riflebacteria bacterium]